MAGKQEKREDIVLKLRQVEVLQGHSLFNVANTSREQVKKVEAQAVAKEDK